MSARYLMPITKTMLDEHRRVAAQEATQRASFCFLERLFDDGGYGGRRPSGLA